MDPEGWAPERKEESRGQGAEEERTLQVWRLCVWRGRGPSGEAGDSGVPVCGGGGGRIHSAMNKRPGDRMGGVYLMLEQGP